MQQSIIQLSQKLKQIEIEFSNKEHIYIEDAVNFIQNIVKTEVEKDFIIDYLKQKGYKVIAEKPQEMKPIPSEENFDLDEFLETNKEPIKHFQNYSKGSNSFESNTDMIQNYQATKDEKLYADIIKQNTRLVYKEVLRLQNWMKHTLSNDDLFQEGIFGLMKAIDRYDSSLGNQFSTYATWWIRQSIIRAICNQGSIVRIPVHMIDQVNKVRRLERQSIHNEYGFNRQFICETLGITEEKYDQLKVIENNFFKMTSLNGIVSENDGDTELLEFISYEHAEVMGGEISDFQDPSILAEKNDITNILFSALEELKEREKDVIIQRFGLLDDRGKTLEEVGKLHGVTRERIRQIELKAIRRLRFHLKRKGL